MPNFLHFLKRSKQIDLKPLQDDGILTRQLIHQAKQRVASETSLSVIKRIFKSLPVELQSKFLSVLELYLRK